MAANQTRRVPIVRHDSSKITELSDEVAVEDPLEISLADTPLAVTMRTPGDDRDLTVGFLLTEGIVLAPDEVRSVDRIDDSRVSVQLADGLDVDPTRFQRNMFVSSSCGVCGKASLEAVQLVAPPARDFSVSRAVVTSLTGRLRQHQPAFDTTGGLHAAGLFDLSGNVLAAREDVGRHNAVDKVIGAVAATVWPLPLCLLVVSGRQSFEVVQKAAMVGVGGVIGVSAPSSLAVDLAERLQMLLVGFSREAGFNVYAGGQKLVN
ncbi:MAG: formate dehydrogenase accessory sulfurtransferase FdhD [Gemmatimonadales bacterium]